MATAMFIVGGIVLMQCGVSTGSLSALCLPFIIMHYHEKRMLYEKRMVSLQVVLIFLYFSVLENVYVYIGLFHFFSYRAVDVQFSI